MRSSHVVSHLNKNIYGNILQVRRIVVTLLRISRGDLFRAFSSAGSEHLPYKQRVGGSNPSTPTKKILSTSLIEIRAFSSAGSEHLPYKQRVGGSNPSTPTSFAQTYFEAVLVFRYGVGFVDSDFPY